MKSTALLFLITGICGGLSAMYLWGGYASGLPTGWWSGPLIYALLAASLGMVLAGGAVFLSLRVSRVVALCSGGVLEAFLIVGVLVGLGSIFSATRGMGLDLTPFAGLILLPFVLTTASLVVAWRVR
jgi:hypothetical protein